MFVHSVGNIYILLWFSEFLGPVHVPLKALFRFYFLHLFFCFFIWYFIQFMSFFLIRFRPWESICRQFHCAEESSNLISSNGIILLCKYSALFSLSFTDSPAWENCYKVFTFRSCSANMNLFFLILFSTAQLAGWYHWHVREISLFFSANQHGN